MAPATGCQLTSNWLAPASTALTEVGTVEPDELETVEPHPATHPDLEFASHPGAVKSPMVGTAYMSAQPGQPAFVRVGDMVSAGQPLLIIEAMKVMNQIRAPKAGKVARILVSDGNPVEFGQVVLVLE